MGGWRLPPRRDGSGSHTACRLVARTAAHGAREGGSPVSAARDPAGASPSRWPPTAPPAAELGGSGATPAAGVQRTGPSRGTRAKLEPSSDAPDNGVGAKAAFRWRDVNDSKFIAEEEAACWRQVFTRIVIFDCACGSGLTFCRHTTYLLQNLLSTLLSTRRQRVRLHWCGCGRVRKTV